MRHTCAAAQSAELGKTDLSFVLGLRQAEGALTLLPFTAFLQELYAFKTLQDGTLAAYGTGCFQAGMLGHDFMCLMKGLESFSHRRVGGRRGFIANESHLGKTNLMQKTKFGSK